MTEASHRTQASAVVERLRDDILAGNLLPGQKLRMSMLTQRYAMGVIPMREALSRLVASGLVTAEDQRGFWVTPISRQELVDLNDARKAIETLALARAIERGEIDWETALVGAHHRITRLSPVRYDQPGTIDTEWEAAHRDFHRALLAGCGSRSLLDVSRDLELQIARYRTLWAWGKRDSDRDLNAEHEALLKATLARDTAEATALLVAHYDRTVNHLLRNSASLQSPLPEDNHTVAVVQPGTTTNRAARAKARSLKRKRPPILG